MAYDKKQARMKALDSARAVAMKHISSRAKSGFDANKPPSMAHEMGESAAEERREEDCR